MIRRRYLAGCAGVAAVGGCLGSGESDSSPPEDPREQVGHYIEEGANNDGAFVEEVGDIVSVEADSGDGYNASLECELEYRSSDQPDSAYEENANWTAYYVFKSVFEQDLDVEQLLITAYVPTVDQQGSEEDTVISEIMMTGETAAEITWDNIGAEEIPANADQYSFDPV
ncbi:hypothetical protein [Halostagnicola kamekurae]|uniref:Uncharacterized protein n=1 Tax=Halostagnicola kamekurae TaxID=619731 RepID=A0A1I6REZ7_9EURY|nr:hypothetical protein [Halostagnicola kamekurae]SFS63309.1 hypothetical protein SAMN04488556_1749 [Halostagnicola kamekurae]